MDTPMKKPSFFATDPTIQNKLREREDSISITVDCQVLDDSADKKVFIQLEPPSVKDFLQYIINNHHLFDLILAWHTDILEACPNAKRFIFGDCWIDIPNFKADKKNQVSFLMSSKAMTEGHKLRHEVYDFLLKYRNQNYTVAAYKTPPRLTSKDVVFEQAKFSIIIENEQHDNWITEKLIDCFVTKTIPIYWGAPNVGEFFDESGMITFSTLEELETILNELDMDDYERLSSVINVNYNKAVKYINFYERVDKELDLL